MRRGKRDHSLINQGAVLKHRAVLADELYAEVGASK